MKHNNIYWNFPKGTAEEGESVLETARREISEETGLVNFEIIPKFKIRNWYFFRGSGDHLKPELRNRLIFKIVTFFIAQAADKTVKISSEHEDYAWLGYKEASERLAMHKSGQKILKKANDFLNTISKKSI